jgi:hypothetical protein
MGKKIFTGEQIEVLLQNKHVLRCSEKTITYHNEFKLKSVKEYNEQFLTAKEIFRNAGFDIALIGKATPMKCLERWNNIYRVRGPQGLITDRRGRGGGRLKTKALTDKDRIKQLEARVAYLKAENDFLAKLRAKRAE